MFRLTIPQENIWNLSKMYPDTAVSNISGMITFSYELNDGALKKVINGFVKDNTAARLFFIEKDGTVYQEITEYTHFMIESLSFLDYDSARTYFEKQGQIPFNYTEKPFYRFSIYHIGKNTGIFVCMSHLIADAWTLSLFCSYVIESYKAVSKSEDYTVLSDYADFALSNEKYISSSRYENDKKYWEGSFAETPELAQIKPETSISRDIDAKRYSETIDGDLYRNICDFCENKAISPAVLFESAIILYLYRINREKKRITIGVPVLNRSTKTERKTAGMYISTVPVLIDVSESDTSQSLIEKVIAAHRSVFRHQKYPYSEILKYVRSTFGFSGNLYDTMVSYQNAQIGHNDIQYHTEWFHNGYSEILFALHIDNRDNDNSFTINIDYQTAVFGNDEIKYLYNRIIFIISQIITNVNTLIDKISIVPKYEYNKLIYDFNNTYTDYPRDKCVHELFTEQAEKTPNKTALVFENEEFTYRQLDEMSNSLANFLRSKGIGRNDIVPIISVRSWHVVVAMLGIIKAGGAYMPVDPNYPVDRINYMISEANSKLALVYGYNGSISIESVDLSKIDYNRDNSALKVINIPEDICYVIFTSGSTGKPKGLFITHNNVINYCSKNDYNVCGKIIKNNHRGIVSVTNIVFDIFVTESILALLNNIPIYFANDKESVYQEQLNKLLTENNVEVIQTTPTKMKQFILNKTKMDYLKSLKIIILGGEIFTEDLYLELKNNTDAEIYNIYGPAETTVWSTFTKLSDTDITIGKPIANTQIYILDVYGNPCPIGVAGELCISGDGVGKGYLNRPELTSEKFVPNPFLEGKTMYKTGDLARWRTDGEIDFLGRIDTQVKIRGLRIELGEIESLMSAFDGIGLSAAADKRDENNRQYLVGYYTSDRIIDVNELRRYLSAKLPKYMVPNFFMRLKEMPMTPSGKIDRKNLPVPDFSIISEEYIAPETETEMLLAEIWSDVLHIDRIGKNSDFTECGGDSLSAITMLAEIEDRFGISIDMKAIMEHTVLSDLAEYIETSEIKADIIPSINVSEYILTPQQKAVYLACMKNPDTLLYNMPMFIKLSENADITKIKENVQKCFNNHSVLKTSITMRNNDVIGVIDGNTQLEIEEFTDRNDFVRPFDLSEAPLMRVGFGENGIAIDIHHIVGDGESVNIILNEIFNGDFSDETVYYTDYAHYLNDKLSGNDFDEHKEYFKKLLSVDIEPVVLPETKISDDKTTCVCVLDKKYADIVKECVKVNKVTETSVYFALYGILLSKYTNREHIVSSIVLSNRTHSETKNTCGMFVNTIPAVFDAKANESFSDYVHTVQNELLETYKYQELPFLEICKTAGIEDKNLINTAFVYQPWIKNNSEYEVEYIDMHSSKFDLTFNVIPQADGTCKLMLEYDCHKYNSELMLRLVAGYEMIISQISSDISMMNISVLGYEEYQKVVYDFNDTYAEYPRDKCVHELFTEQAEKTPDKTALVFENEEFTYRQLDEMSNSLANFLRSKGIGRNDIVPIISVRSWHIVVAMLGIIKAGGAYMPVDPNYPIDRINYMISEANSKLALVYGYKGSVSIENVDLSKIDYNRDNSALKVINIPDDICYVIFTSGSTGNPKGAILKHSGLINFTSKSNVFHKTVFCDCNTILAIGNFTFDISIVEIFQPLLNGLCTVIASDDTISSAIKLASVIERNRIDFIHATPTRLNYYLENPDFKGNIKNIKVILAAGEELTGELYHRIKDCSDAIIFNGYGPTETTVGCSFAKITDIENITIGRPISNVQIYILDIWRNTCPIGVTGELCISGDSVGKGYLNRPELTAEKFVPDPFRKGQTMYKTGDLARWRDDGEIEFLGRIDTQVKIRGLRIELGEIESAILSYQDINMSAAAVKNDSNGRKYIVGYYTCKNKIDVNALRRYLSNRLPKYMIPNFFMELGSIPMNTSGKIDRKKLPDIENIDYRTEYVAPKNERQSILCDLIAEILNYDKIGITDDFFDLGGDSLKAIELAAKAHDHGIELELQSIFEFPTVGMLCYNIDNSDSIAYSVEDFIKYEPVLALPENFEQHTINIENVFITGATGFLGTHLIDALLNANVKRIYCLVRGNDKENAQQRLSSVLHFYFNDKYDGMIGDRIISLEGDILETDSYDNFSGCIDMVIHAAATVKHYGEYSYFEKVNVKGTANILKFAKDRNACFAYISTASVGGSYLNTIGNDTAIFKESDIYIGQNLDNPYIRSKFEAERLVLDAKLNGANCVIFRIGNLTNRSSDLKFQPNYYENAFLQRIKAFVNIERYPSEIADYLTELSPVDLTAKAIVLLARNVYYSSTIYHVYNTSMIKWSELFDMFQNAGKNIVRTDSIEIEQLLSENSEYDSVRNELYEAKKYAPYSKVHTDSEFTARCLKQLGFEWNTTDTRYISEYIRYFGELGLWE